MYKCLQDWVYTITWEDGTTEQYSNIDTVNEMFDAAMAAADDATVAPTEDPWAVGTHVYRDFGDEGWWHGVITSFENDVYTVVWDDGSTEPFDYISEIDSDVANAANYVAFADGTPVVRDSMSGSITSYAVRLCAGNHAGVVVFRCRCRLRLLSDYRGVCGAAQHWL